MTFTTVNKGISLFPVFLLRSCPHFSSLPGPKDEGEAGWLEEEEAEGDPKTSVLKAAKVDLLVGRKSVGLERKSLGLGRRSIGFGKD